MYLTIKRLLVHSLAPFVSIGWLLSRHGSMVSTAACYRGGPAGFKSRQVREFIKLLLKRKFNNSNLNTIIVWVCELTGLVLRWIIVSLTYFLFTLKWNKLNDQKQVFCLLYAIWLKSKDLYPTYLKATQPPSILGKHQVTIKLARLATPKTRLAFMNMALINNVMHFRHFLKPLAPLSRTYASSQYNLLPSPGHLFVWRHLC